MKLNLSQLGLLLALALILSYIEAQLPFFGGVPGMKLGLPNLAVVLCLYLYGWREALAVNVLRIVLSGFLFGSMAAILFSLAGAAVSFLAMLLLKRTGIFGVSGVSLAGGVSHNAGQLLIAMYVVRTAGILYYLPALVIAGCITGFLIGVTAGAVMPYLRRRGA